MVIERDDPFLSQSLVFRGKLAVSFREGMSSLCHWRRMATILQPLYDGMEVKDGKTQKNVDGDNEIKRNGTFD